MNRSERRKAERDQLRMAKRAAKHGITETQVPSAEGSEDEFTLTREINCPPGLNATQRAKFQNGEKLRGRGITKVRTPRRDR